MNLLTRLWPFVRPYRRDVLLGFLCLIISDAAGIAAPHLIGRAIDVLALPDFVRGTLFTYAALIVAATLVSGFARFWMRLLLNGYSRRVENDLRDAYFAQLMQLDAGFYTATRTGDLMSRATNDVSAVRMAIGPGVMYGMNTLVMSAFTLAVMMHTSARLTLIALVPLVFLAPVMLYFGRAIHQRFQRIQDHFGDLSTMVQENLSGVRIVRAYNQEAAQEREFDALSRGYLDKNLGLARVSALFDPLLSLFAGMGVLVVLWFGGREVMAGSMTPGDFVAFLFYLGLLTWPMMALGWVVNLFQRGAASLGRITQILDAVPAVGSPATPVRLHATRGEIEFRNVWFRYPDTERDVLRDVSFRIAAGSTVALVGPTGAGKSTIIALLTRRYDPVAGEVLLDGVPVNQLALADLRAAIAVVPQDAFVFSDTIAHNIALGMRPGMEADGRVERAATIARLAETIARFPEGYETRLGERGVNLSGGQRQRTTLARALVRDPSVLILDDALSAVDTHTEAEILRELRTVLHERTAVLVSHRLTAVMNADDILVLDAGRIAERGRHADLIGARGLYASLLHRQLLAEDLGDEAVATASERR
jgi:ATP-binding cassette subfamily B protein